MKNIRRLMIVAVALSATLSIVPISGVQASADTYKATTSQNSSQATAVKHAQGWVKESDGFWRYGNADGTAKTGWFQDGNTWYYLYSCKDGGMASNCYVGAYKIDTSGAWIQNAPVPSTRQGYFGLEYLGERTGTVFTDSSLKTEHDAPLRIIDDLLKQGKIAKGNYTNSNVGKTSDWYLK